MQVQRSGRIVAAMAAVLLTLPAVAAAAGTSFLGQRPPEIEAQRWINSDPLSLASLRGRVVLLEFWSPG